MRDAAFYQDAVFQVSAREQLLAEARTLGADEAANFLRALCADDRERLAQYPVLDAVYEAACAEFDDAAKNLKAAEDAQAAATIGLAKKNEALDAFMLADQRVKVARGACFAVLSAVTNNRKADLAAVERSERNIQAIVASCLSGFNREWEAATSRLGGSVHIHAPDQMEAFNARLDNAAAKFDPIFVARALVEYPALAEAHPTSSKSLARLKECLDERLRLQGFGVQQNERRKRATSVTGGA